MSLCIQNKSEECRRFDAPFAGSVAPENFSERIVLSTPEKLALQEQATNLCYSLNVIEKHRIESTFERQNDHRLPGYCVHHGGPDCTGCQRNLGELVRHQTKDLLVETTCF